MAPILLSSLFLALLMSSCSSINAVEGGGEMTPLQKHVAFFDRNNDGKIYPAETFQGFRAIGCSVSLSLLGASFINGALSLKTCPEKSIRLPICVENIKKGKHGSDSGAYDAEGRFVPEKFEEIFQKHAHTNPNALTYKELSEMLDANKVPNDAAGVLGSRTEWNILYLLCKDKDGLLQKDTIRDVYDGSLFYKMEESHKKAWSST